MRYSPTMRDWSPYLVAFAGIALVSFQMSGLHMHAGTQSDDATIHGAHIHSADPDGHDHSADIDVFLLDLGIVWSKLMPFLVALSPTALAIIWIFHSLRPTAVKTFPLRRRSHWRPPLRAPPLSP